MKRAQKAEFVPTSSEVALLQKIRRMGVEDQEFLQGLVSRIFARSVDERPALRLIQGGVKS